MLVSGEAGVGKTTLLRQFCAGAAAARVLSGACDGLFTPRPLGPLLDIARDDRGQFAALLTRRRAASRGGDGARTRTGDAEATVLVLEDVHWADEATLDVLKLLARRAQTVPALVLVSYRDDELDRAHPLRVVVGRARAAQGTRRVKLMPLSPDGSRSSRTHAA